MNRLTSGKVQLGYIAHDQAQQAQRDAARRGDVVTQVGFGFSKVGARSTQVLVVLAGGQVVVAGGQAAAATSTGQAILATPWMAAGVQGGATVLQTAQPVMVAAAGIKGFENLQSSSSLFGQGDYTGAIDNAGDALLNFAIAADLTRSLAGIPSRPTPINPWTLPRTGAGPLANQAAAETVAESTAPALEPFETVPSLVTTEEGLTLPAPSKAINCFPPETLVATEGGPKAIGQIEAGERVWGYDFQAGFWRLYEVECRMDNVFEGSLITLHLDGGVVTATERHPFWVVQGDDLEGRREPGHLGGSSE